MSKPIEAVMVCAYADSVLTIEGSTYTRSCRDCQRRLVVSQAGERALEKEAIATICGACYNKLSSPFDTFETAGTTEEVMKDLATRVRLNHWKPED